MLGPLLFMVMIHDLAFATSLIYADGTTKDSTLKETNFVSSNDQIDRVYKMRISAVVSKQWTGAN